MQISYTSTSAETGKIQLALVLGHFSVFRGKIYCDHLQHESAY